MRGATICTGIGSPELAAPWIDWRWCAEIDKHACAVLRHRHPHIHNLGDMTRITADAAEAVDLIVAGTPCQDFSVAGLRAGLAGERGNLTLQFVRLLGDLRPRWFVLENVPGLLSMDEGRAFGFILGAMADIGYGFAYRVLDAQYAGVAQRRERVFVVGYLGDWRPPAAVLFERESLRRDSPPSREAGERVAPTIEARATAGGGAWGTDFLAGGGLAEHVAGTLEASIERSRGAGTSPAAITAYGLSSDCLDRSGEAANGSAADRPGLGILEEHTPALRGRAAAVAYGGNNTAGPIDVGTACRAKGGTGHGDFETETFIAFDCKAGGKTSFAIGETPGSIRGEGHGGGHLAVAFSGRARGDDGRGYDRPPLAMVDQAGAIDTVKPWNVAAETAVRRLTPRECERLQGLPDDFTLVPYRGKPMADGPRYRMVGNGMAVPVIGWVLDRIGMVDAHLAE